MRAVLFLLLVALAAASILVFAGPAPAYRAARRAAPENDTSSDRPPPHAAIDVDACVASLRSRLPEERWRSTLLLSEAGPDAVGALLRCCAAGSPFEVEDWEGQRWIAEAHARYAIDRMGAEALPGLVAALADEDLRECAIAALGRFGRKHDGAIEHLLPLLETYPVTVTHALRLMGPRAAPAAARVAALVGEKEAGWAAVGCLLELGPPAVPFIERELRRSSDGYLMTSLYKLGDAAAPLVPLLIDCLRHEDRALQRDAIWALQSLGPVAAAALPALFEAAAEPDVRPWPTNMSRPRCAVHALLAIGVPPDTEERLRLRLFADGGDAENVARLGELMGPRAADFAPRLATTLRRREAWANSERVAALGPIVVPAVLAELRTHAESRLGAMFTLARLGDAAAPALPDALDALSDPSEHVRYAALAVIGNLGAAAGRHVDAVSALLRDTDQRVRAEAALGLAKLTGDVRPAVALLPGLGVTGFSRLEEIGPPAAGAAGALIDFLVSRREDHNEFPRTHDLRVAASALDRIDVVPEGEASKLRPALDYPFEIRVPIALLLRRHGDTSMEVRQVLIEAARAVNGRTMDGHRFSRSESLRIAAIEALAAGRERAATPVLCAVASSAQGELKRVVEQAIDALED